MRFSRNLSPKLCISLLRKIHGFRTIACCAALLCVCSQAVVAADKAPMHYQEGVFWSISKDEKVIGYILGTFHSNDSRVTNLPKNVKEKLLSASSFSMEAFPGSRYFNPHWGFRSIIRDMTLPKGKTLEDVVGKDLYLRVEKIMLHMGVKRERFRRLYPWAVMNELGVIKGTADQARGPIMDHMMFELVAQKTDDLYQVETLEELVAAYYDFPLDVQVSLLRDRVDNHENVQGNSSKMLKAYLAENLQEMLDISTRFISDKSVKKGYKKIYLKNALFERNHVMAHHMLAPLRRKNTFIAVGALHMYGKESVLQLLQNYGFKLKRVSLH